MNLTPCFETHIHGFSDAKDPDVTDELKDEPNSRPGTPATRQTLGKLGVTSSNWVVVSNIFYFHPCLGKIPILTNIFQRGWNHQLGKVPSRELTYPPFKGISEDDFCFFPRWDMLVSWRVGRLPITPLED